MVEYGKGCGSGLLSDTKRRQGQKRIVSVYRGGSLDFMTNKPTKNGC